MPSRLLNNPFLRAKVRNFPWKFDGRVCKTCLIQQAASGCPDSQVRYGSRRMCTMHSRLVVLNATCMVLRRSPRVKSNHKVYNNLRNNALRLSTRPWPSFS